ncbi:coiled-coil domain-containing protein 12 [Blastomyces parvus]|uniref:Coiled-coil domain-containing protein 12 n=1 Tax=Blastomyces parvus TaxID=2060905 RepID=A0A2B7XBL9_9EURO|nr:coiled-coil domain-containing protein 12 [Blastomyces parvus]
MSSSHSTLDAAATDRKARLAKLASLKRKQPEQDSAGQDLSKQDSANEGTQTDVSNRYLSGRNYDPETRGPKLGFEHVPIHGQTTLEEQASRIAISTEQAAKEDEEADKPIDLFKLQPKKPNWDLKRDLDEKMKIVNVRTQNAIARLVRERIQNAQKEAKGKRNNMVSEEGDVDGDGQELGIDGGALVEGIHLRERDEAEEERREKEEDAEMS